MSFQFIAFCIFSLITYMGVRLKKILLVVLMPLVLLIMLAAKPQKAKFYDFREQLIDGELRRPTTLYTNSRTKVKFERLLKLKKSFMNDLYDTAKEKVFR